LNEELDGVRAETLLADVARLRGTPCPACRAPLDGRGVLGAVWLGFRDAPRCLRCVAAGLGREPSEFAAHVRAALLRRDCYREAWETVVDREGGSDDGAAPAAVRATPAAPVVAAAAADAAPDAVYDAGDLGCGDLVLELRTRLRAMPPRAVLALSARDPGAREDIPAWCGLVGHALLRAAHPEYLIRRKDD
jgi:tRNA 2-thiouridine synthesizing protein A